jgi:hypothetical protein
MDNNIRLVFKGTVTNLAGNRFGNEVFLEQVQGKIDEKNKNVVIFPETIEDIASSFIEGFYKYLAEKYGKEKAIEIMKLKAEHPESERKIENSIETYGV